MKIDIKSREKFVSAAKKLYGENKKVLTRPEVQTVVKKYKLDFPNWLTVNKAFRAQRGSYYLAVMPPETATGKVEKKAKPKKAKEEFKVPLIVPTVPTVENAEMNIAPAAAKDNHLDLVPEQAKGYVPFGHFDDLERIVDSNLFYPVYITGLSGNGKTMMVEQVYAKLKREVIRVNVTIETDEDDLIGGFRLVNGATVWQNGPVIVAMERGAGLILDEVDLGSNKLMCLQPILEGKGIFIKKINQFIAPKAGFNIIATANTKGKGSDDGRFIGTNVMNEAFLERFSITMEQEYPAEKVEMKILNNVLKASGVEDDNFTKMLVTWAAALRDTFREGGITEVISTRRLVHICQAYSIFGRNRKKALELCLSRFDEETKSAMFTTYTKIDESMGAMPSSKVDPNLGAKKGKSIPF